MTALRLHKCHLHCLDCPWRLQVPPAQSRKTWGCCHTAAQRRLLGSRPILCLEGTGLLESRMPVQPPHCGPEGVQGSAGRQRDGAADSETSGRPASCQPSSAASANTASPSLQPALHSPFQGLWVMRNPVWQGGQRRVDELLLSESPSIRSSSELSPLQNWKTIVASAFRVITCN